MQHGGVRWTALLLAFGLGLASSACSSPDRLLREQRDQLRALNASTAAISEAWLADSASATFAASALRQVSFLLEQQRHALSTAPEALIDPRGVELSQAAERLGRVLAAMIHDVHAKDAPAMRRHLSQLPALGD